MWIPRCALLLGCPGLLLPHGAPSDATDKNGWKLQSHSLQPESRVKCSHPKKETCFSLCRLPQGSPQNVHTAFFLLTCIQRSQNCTATNAFFSCKTKKKCQAPQKTPQDKLVHNPRPHTKKMRPTHFTETSSFSKKLCCPKSPGENQSTLQKAKD